MKWCETKMDTLLPPDAGLVDPARLRPLVLSALMQAEERGRVLAAVPGRRRLPDRRKAWTNKLRINGQSVFLTVGEYEDGTPGEIFVNISKAGSSLRCMTDSWAKGVSYALQHGCPLALLVDGYLNVQCEPCGAVEGHPDVVRALSIPDLVVRVLALAYLGRRDLATAPPAEPSEVPPPPTVGEDTPAAPETVVDVIAPILPPRRAGRGPETSRETERREADDTRRGDAAREGYSSGERCDRCQSFKTRRTGSCLTCDSCGNSLGSCG